MGHEGGGAALAHGAHHGRAGGGADLGHVIAQVGGLAELEQQPLHAQADVLHDVVGDPPGLFRPRHGGIPDVVGLDGPGLEVIPVPDLIAQVGAHTVPGEPPQEHLRRHAGHEGAVGHEARAVGGHGEAHLQGHLALLQKVVAAFHRGG